MLTVFQLYYILVVGEFSNHKLLFSNSKKAAASCGPVGYVEHGECMSFLRLNLIQ